MQVIARPDESMVVQVGGSLVEGWIAEPVCPSCRGSTVYFLAYDATCCARCNVWLELRCPEPDCLHCRLRPEQPWPQQ